jgi:hypothetical protein
MLLLWLLVDECVGELLRKVTAQMTNDEVEELKVDSTVEWLMRVRYGGR